MRPRTLIRLLARVSLVALLAGFFAYQWPRIWLAPVGRLAGVLSERLSPWLENMTVQADDFMLNIQGQIHLHMTLSDETPLPVVPGTWNKHGGQSLAVGVVAAAVWAAGSVGWRRWGALAATLLVAAVAAAFVLAVEIQDSALQSIGYEWLPGLSFADIPANHRAFANLEEHFRWIQGFKAFHDAGGRLFYSLVAAWMGYLLPLPGSSKPSSSPDSAVPCPSVENQTC